MSVNAQLDAPPKRPVSKDLLAGNIAGWARVFVGQPFDIVKVRLQSTSEYSGAFNCAKRILAEEGPLAFYKGTVMPLLGIGTCVALQFGCLQVGKQYFIDQNKARGIADPTFLSVPQLFLAGSFAGVGNSIAASPVEHIRIRLQSQSASTGKTYSGPFDLISKVFKTDGIRGIYQGLTATVLREAWGYGVYFCVYESTIQQVLKNNGWKRSELPVIYAGVVGAGAGWAMWLSDYPLDVIKSRIQTDGFPSQPEKRKYNGIADVARKLYAQGGWKAFTRGIGPTLTRAPFVNAASFVTFETAMKGLNTLY